MKLRPYQEHAVSDMIRALSKQDRALCVMATGGGKTEIMIALAAKAKRRVVVLMGRNRLIAQTAKRFRKVIPETCVWSAGEGEKRIGHVTVVSIHSADLLTIPEAGLVIVDECHNMNEGRYTSFISRHKGAKVAGFTATPWRQAVPIYGDHYGASFPSVTYQRGLLQLVKAGYLVPAVAKHMPLAFDASGVEIVAGDYNQGQLGALVCDQTKVHDQVIDAIKRLEDRHHVVWICTSIEHAEMVANELALAAQSYSVIHSKVETEGALKGFEDGTFRHVVSVMMLTEGIDIPCIDAIVLMRPTRSPTLMVQAVGRGLRPSKGKTDCLVLDYGDVFENCGPLPEPYLRKPGKKKEPMEATIGVCPACLSYIPIRAKECPDCGHVNQVEVDRLKALSRMASNVDPMGAHPVAYDCYKVNITQHKSKNGNDCIRIDFHVRGRMWPIPAWGNDFPRSWKIMKALLKELTPFEFETWRECFEAVPTLEGYLNVPKKVMVQKNGEYENVCGIEN